MSFQKATPSLPLPPASAPLDHEVIRQKRLRKFLMNCAKNGEPTPLPLDATKQSNATFDTMMEVAAECEAIGIPKSNCPIAYGPGRLYAPPTPDTGDSRCRWNYHWHETYTPEIPENDEAWDDYNYPNFDKVLGSYVDDYEEEEVEEEEVYYSCESYDAQNHYELSPY